MGFSPLKENSNRRLAFAAAVSLLTFFAIFASKMPFLTDSFLLADDLIYIPKLIIIGSSFSLQGTPIFTDFLSIVSWLFLDPVLLRMSFIFVFTLALGIFGLTLLYEFKALTVVLITLIASLIQMGVNQAMLIGGSYPMFGVALLLIAFSFVYSSSNQKDKRLVLMISGYFFVTLSQFTHPIFILTPLAFLVLIPIFDRKYAVINIVCIAAAYFLRFIFMSTYIYHYSQLKGWVDYSISGILKQTARGAEYIWSYISIDGQILLILLLCTGITFFLLSLAENKFDRIEKKRGIIALFFLVLSVLTYGPTSVVVNNLQTRYFYTPQLFCLLSLIIFIVSTAKNGYQRAFVNTLLILICASFFINGKEINRTKFYDIQHTQSIIKKCLDRFYLSNESPNDQIVILLERIPSFFTGGYNHWSTWFLRYQTGNKNIIGLVGTKALCGAVPIVEKYQDHGEEYWSVMIDNGREISYRIRMKGLEKSKNTFAYVQNKNDFIPIPFVVIPTNSGLFYVAEYGKPFKIVKPDEPEIKAAGAHGFLWPVNDLIH